MICRSWYKKKTTKLIRAKPETINKRIARQKSNCKLGSLT